MKQEKKIAWWILPCASFHWQALRMDEMTFWLSCGDNATTWRLGRGGRASNILENVHLFRAQSLK